MKHYRSIIRETCTHTKNRMNLSKVRWPSRHRCFVPNMMMTRVVPGTHVVFTCMVSPPKIIVVKENRQFVRQVRGYSFGGACEPEATLGSRVRSARPLPQSLHVHTNAFLMKSLNLSPVWGSKLFRFSAGSLIPVY